MRNMGHSSRKGRLISLSDPRIDPLVNMLSTCNVVPLILLSGKKRQSLLKLDRTDEKPNELLALVHCSMQLRINFIHMQTSFGADVGHQPLY